MKQSLILAFCLALAPAAHAFNVENARIASDLGTLLGSESLCELSFDHDAIDAYIDANVDHSDMGFASSLTGQIALAEFTQSDMSDSARRAHCRAIAATARQHGFID